MKRLRFHHASVADPIAELDIPVEPVAAQDSLKAWLDLLFPERMHRWTAADRIAAVRVASFEPSPPAPDAARRLAFLFPDPARAAEEVRERLRLRRVEIDDA